MRTRRNACTIAFILASLSLVSCGGGGGGSASTPVPAPPSAPPPPPATPSPPPLPENRSGFLRLDDVPKAAVFDATHKLVFATAPDLDLVYVISTQTDTVIKTISVANPQGIDISLDNSKVIVGTGTNQFYTIDATQLAVISRTTLPTTPANPQHIQPLWPVVTANGTILFVGSGNFPIGVFQWNPKTLSLSPRADAPTGETAHATRSQDGTKALFFDPFGGGATLYDSASDKFLPLQLPAGQFPDGAASNPAGTQFVVSLLTGLFIFDSSGNLIQQINTEGFGAVYTTDGGSILAASSPNQAFEIVSYDTSTFQITGAAPGYASAIPFFLRDPALQVEVPLTVDDTGLIYGAADHGMALDDSKNFQNIPAAAIQPEFTIIAEPSEGALNASTNVSIQTQSFSDIPDVFFGTQRGTNLQVNSAGQVQVTAPPSNVVGPVNIKIEEPNGVLSYIPQGFTYGSVISQQVVQAAPTAGGVTADIYGYGLGVDLEQANTQVKVGSADAPVTLSTFWATETPYPFLLQHLKVTVPPGNTGASDLKITTGTSSTTLQRGIHYFQSVNDISSSDTFTNIAFDQARNRLYLSAGNHVDVLNLATSTFLAPIPLPSLNGRMLTAGLVLTPDGKDLLVANHADRSIAVINPDNPASAKAVNIPLTLPPSGSSCAPGPGQVIATATGKAYASITDNAEFGCSNRGVIELDLPSLTAAVRIDGALSALVSSGALLGGTRSGKAAAIDDFNNIYVWDTATDSWTSRMLDNNSNLFDIALSADGNVYAINTFGTATQERYIFIDSSLNLIGNLLQPEFSETTGSRVPGVQLHDTGSLLYAPLQNGIDIYDVHEGSQRERVLLAETLAATTSQMAIDETGLRIFLLTARGLSIVQLDSVPLSLGNVTPSIGSSSGGVAVTLRGSGFQAGSKVTLGSTTVTATFLDANTIQIVTPQTSKGPLQVTIQNPDGQSYTLDDAYSAN